MPPRDTGFPEGNDVVLRKSPCTSCSSSDGMATYADGHTHCFVCGQGTPPGSAADPGAGPSGPHHGRAAGPRAEASGLLKPAHDLPQSDEARVLKKATYAKFGYFKAGFKGQSVEVAPLFDMEGELVTQKVRLSNKEFIALYGTDPKVSPNDC